MRIRMIQKLHLQWLHSFPTLKCTLSTPIDSMKAAPHCRFGFPCFLCLLSWLTMGVCQRLRDTSPAFSEAISKIEAGKQKGFFGLKNLTITPIQRIPRYRMLLAELLKRTDASGMPSGQVALSNFFCSHTYFRFATRAPFQNCGCRFQCGMFHWVCGVGSFL